MNRSFELLNHLHNRKSHFSELPFHVETLLYKVSNKEIIYPAENVRDLGVMLTIVNGLVRRALLRTSCLGLIFREESGARYFEEI